MTLNPEKFEPVEGDVAADRAFDGNVAIAGNVSACKVTAESLRVAGDVQGASLIARGSIEVVGVLTGGPNQRNLSGLSFRCRRATSATLIAGENLNVGESLENCRISSGGVVTVRGTILGGRTVGNGGIRCDVAGSPDGTPTILAAGVDLYFAAVFARHRPDVDRDLALARRTREQVEPLLAQLKTLDAGQKESVTVSLCEADQLQQAARQQQDHLRDLYDRSLEKTRTLITVGEQLHAGVSLQLGAFRAAVRQAVPGPLTVSLFVHDGKATIDLETADRGVINLPATACADPTSAFHRYFDEIPRRAARAA